MGKIFSFLRNYTAQHFFKFRIKPRTLQMPITGFCNSRCVTCNVWKTSSSKVHMNPEYLKEALKDPFFAKVESIGLNGGEPSLYPDFEKLLDAIFILPRLHDIFIISNGLHAGLLKKMMLLVKEKCACRKIKVHLCISIDGVGKTHNHIRGVHCAFEKTMLTLKELNTERQIYCDELSIGTTLSMGNITRAVEIECLIEKLNIPIHCHLAVPNRRLHNFDSSDFSVINDKRSSLIAMAYFYSRFKYAKGFRKRIMAFCIYFYLKHKGHRRIAGCNFLRSDVTITEKMDLFLCATASECIGNLTEHTASELLASKKFAEIESKTEQCCDECIHYVSFPTFRGLLLYIVESLKSINWIYYKIKAELMQCCK